MNILELLHSATERDLEQLDLEIETLRSIRNAVSARLKGITLSENSRSWFPPVPPQVTEEAKESLDGRTVVAPEPMGYKDIGYFRHKVVKYVKEGPKSIKEIAETFEFSERDAARIVDSKWFDVHNDVVTLTERGRKHLG